MLVAIPITIGMQGLFTGFVTTRIHGHWFVLIRQTAGLLKHALAAVCNVPVLVTVILSDVIKIMFKKHYWK